MTFRFSIEQLNLLVGLAIDRGSMIPQQDDNLKWLAMWRLLLTQCSIEQRAQLAVDRSFFQKACRYIPLFHSYGGKEERPLDWDRLQNPKQHKYAELIEEEQRWMEAGLISGRTLSSTEWPAVCLVESCLKTGTPMPGFENAIWMQIQGKNPSVLQALLPFAEGMDWEAFLRAPYDKHNPNKARLPSVFSQSEPAIGKILRPFLTPALLSEAGGENGSLFHSRFMTSAQLYEWLDVGVPADSVDKQGRYAEEIWAYMEPDVVMSMHQTLARYRSTSVKEHAMARTCWNLVAHHPWEKLEAAGVVQHLLAGQGLDPREVPSVVVKHVTEANKGSNENPSVPIKNMLRICDAVAKGGHEGARWTALMGGSNNVHATMLAVAMLPDRFTIPMDSLKALPVGNWEETLLTCFSMLPTQNLAVSVVAEDLELYSRVPLSIHQWDRWTSLVEKHQVGLENWMYRFKSGVNDFGFPLLNGWVAVVEKLVTIRPEIASHPSWVPTVFLAGLALEQARKNRDYKGPPTPVLDEMAAARPRSAAALEWLKGAPESVKTWAEKNSQELHAFMRSAVIDEALPVIPSASSPKPRF